MHSSYVFVFHGAVGVVVFNETNLFVQAVMYRATFQLQFSESYFNLKEQCDILGNVLIRYHSHGCTLNMKLEPAGDWLSLEH